MSENGSYQELFSRYSAEVGSYLPRRKRKDIQLEILSLLEDSIEGRSEEAGRVPDEEMAIEVLKELGPPITFAENYQTRRSLIGPEVFPTFRWALIFTAGIFLLQFVIGLFVGEASGQGFLDVLDSFLDKGFQFFGALVFIFAVLEFTIPANMLRWPFQELEKSWDPAGLKLNRKEAVVKPGELWVEVLFLAGMIILLAVFPQWVGFANNRDGVWSFMPVLSESFSFYLPWVLAYFLVKIAFNVALSRQVYIDHRMRWLSLGVRLLGIGLLITFLTGPEVFGLNPAYLAQHSTPQKMVDWFTASLPVWNLVIRIYFIVKLVTEALAVLVTLLKAVRNQKGPELSQAG